MEKLILPDGTAIGSGVPGEAAICQVVWTQNRNEGAELALGSACIGELEIELFSPKKPDFPHGTRLIYEENGVTRGIFYCQSLERLSKSRWVLRSQVRLPEGKAQIGVPDAVGILKDHGLIQAQGGGGFLHPAVQHHEKHRVLGRFIVVPKAEGQLFAAAGVSQKVPLPVHHRHAPEKQTAAADGLVDPLPLDVK